MTTWKAKMTTGDALLARLNALFVEDPQIDEIGLLFAGEEDEVATEETAFLLAEHKLGVALSAGPLVFRAARSRFHRLNAQLRSGRNVDEIREELLNCTRAIVLISADFYTAWNTRKEYVRRGWLDARSEIHFTNLVFSLHPKSIDTWAYRRWLAARVLDEGSDNGELDTFFLEQVAVCATHTERTPRNYHAWSYRHWIVSRFDKDQLERELRTMQTWCETHLMDHSGWNHRQHTIRCLLNAVDHDGRGMLLDEVAFLSKILSSYPLYEALWCHRRFIFESLFGHPRVDLATNTDDDQSMDEVRRLQEAVGRRDDSVAEGDGLAVPWQRVHELLSQDSVTNGVIADVSIAWSCGRSNRFARRYGLWLLQRLLTKLPPIRSPLKEALAAIATEIRGRLVSEDSLLDDLWRSSMSMK